MNRLKNGGNHFPAGVKEVFKVCGVFGKTVTAEDLSFSVGPLINAAGRLGKSSLAAETFLEADPLKAAEKAAQLKKLNEQRRTLSREALDLLSEEKNIFLSEKLVVAYDEKIHRGISGLVAGKLAEKYKKAALVLVHDGECLRGSIRSYDNEDVFSLLKDHEDFFIQYGGHRQAAGFSLAYEKREEFIQTILQASSQLVCEVNSDDKNYLMEIQDFELQRQIWEEPQIFEPYGKGNPYPALLLKPTQEVIPEPLGKTGEHSKIRFSGINDPLIEAVWFFRKPEEVPTEKKLLFQPQKNYFGGSLKFQMKILSSHEE
ncbi:MAG: hypothetical protein D6767_07160 [Candidatus Hydrogenedentota bacterium]|nr:MAG: hypothetical protein D6767_07160 [Candidatus Hydrogenedentota bacterium]